MEKNASINKADIIKNQRITMNSKTNDNSVDIIKNNPAFEILTAEGHETFANYIEWLGLAKDPNLVVLSSIHHFYYDVDEMKDVKTVVNLKELNQIKRLDRFLHSMSHTLPPKSNFIGCFIDNKKQNGFALRENSSSFNSQRNSEAVENNILSKIPLLNKIYSMMDARTNKYMSRRNVKFLLENHGFKVIDMTELDGLTYFCTQSFRIAES
jgi:hypothetical protein